jgi:NAD(P)-dependent dehydrogenase (short-subunit alcohol dehydrogenase family)
MYEDILGRRVLVTGASRGLGFHLARRFKAAGAVIAINGRDKIALASAAEALGADLHIAGDVSSSNEAKVVADGVIAGFGGLDILVCNVGSGRSARPGQEVSEDWSKSIAMNLFSATNMVEHLKEQLVNSAGCILCISSICGVNVIPDAPVTYSAAKSALNAFVKGVSKPLGKDGVRVNAIAPGNLLFNGSVWEQKMQRDAKSVEKMLIEQVPLGMLGRVDDVANLAMYLSSDQAKFITGGIFVVDGGQVR